MLEETPFKTLKNGRSQFEDMEMNLLSAANFPINVCICLLVLGGFICKTELPCSGETSMPRLLTRYSKNLPNSILKAHLSGWRRNRWCLIIKKASFSHQESFL